MTREYSDYIQDIHDAIRDIKNFVKDFDYTKFENDQKTINAVIRSLEVIGEASKNIPDDIKKKYPKTPWRGLAGMRDKLIHEYFGVDTEILWQVASEEITEIEISMNQLVQNLLHPST